LPGSYRAELLADSNFQRMATRLNCWLDEIFIQFT
jgi:hypothetical protein